MKNKQFFLNFLPILETTLCITLIELILTDNKTNRIIRCLNEMPLKEKNI